MNILLVIHLIGRMLLVESFLMIPSILIALADRGSELSAWAISVLITAAVGCVMALVRPNDDRLRPREGFMTVALTWGLVSFFGALPFRLSNYIPSMADAFFETVSGFTTTGATILTDIEALPRSLLFWRSFAQWVGGMGVLVLSLAILPRMGGRSIFLMRAESPGPSPGKLVPRIGNTAKILYALYLSLSVILFVILLLCGMDWFDSLIHTMATAGTGGFSNYNASVGQFQSPVIDCIIGIFLLLFGTNFTIYFWILQRNFKAIRENSELKLYIAIVTGAVLLIALNITPLYRGFGEGMQYSFFQVTSIISSAGYATADFNQWPMFSKSILFILMLTGCCAGSTGGGMKLVRVVMLFKGVKREIRRTVHPRSVAVIRVDGRAVDEEIYGSVALFVFGCFALMIVGTMIVSLDNFDFESTFTAVVACASNMGPGFGMVGPTGNFSQFSDMSKLVLSACMLLGRLELYPILLLLSRKTWTKN